MATLTGRTDRGFCSSLALPEHKISLCLLSWSWAANCWPKTPQAPALAPALTLPEEGTTGDKVNQLQHHPCAMCHLQEQLSPPTYLVHSLKSSLEGSCSSLSQQASTSCEGTSGTWSSLWGQRDGVRHREQSPRVLLWGQWGKQCGGL